MAEDSACKDSTGTAAEEDAGKDSTGTAAEGGAGNDSSLVKCVVMASLTVCSIVKCVVIERRNCLETFIADGCCMWSMQQV